MVRIGSSGAAYSGGIGCVAGSSPERQGVCNGCPQGTALAGAETLTWASGSDDSGAMHHEDQWHNIRAYTAHAEGWELCFA